MRRRLHVLLFLIMICTCWQCVNEAEAKSKVMKYSITILKGRTYEPDALYEEIEQSSNNGRKKFPFAITNSKVKWSSKNKNVIIKGTKFKTKKEGTYLLIGTCKRYPKYQYQLTLKAKKRLDTATETYQLKVAAQTQYQIRTLLASQFTYTTESKLGSVYQRRKLSWKSTQKNCVVKGNSIKVSKPGAYRLTGYDKYNKNYRYILTITAYQPQLSTSLGPIKKIELMKAGVVVTITDEAKIKQFNDCFSQIKYEFDFDKSNKRLVGFLYIVSLYGDSQTPMMRFSTTSGIGTNDAKYKTTDDHHLNEVLDDIYSK